MAYNMIGRGFSQKRGSDEETQAAYSPEGAAQLAAQALLRSVARQAIIAAAADAVTELGSSHPFDFSRHTAFPGLGQHSGKPGGPGGDGEGGDDDNKVRP